MAQQITWGLVAEHSDKKRLPINRAPRPGELIERDGDVSKKISRVVDYGGEIWIFVEDGEEELAEELTPIKVKEINY